MSSWLLRLGQWQVFSTYNRSKDLLTDYCWHYLVQSDSSLGQEPRDVVKGQEVTLGGEKQSFKLCLDKNPCCPWDLFLAIVLFLGFTLSGSRQWGLGYLCFRSGSFSQDGRSGMQRLLGTRDLAAQKQAQRSQWRQSLFKHAHACACTHTHTLT